MKIEKDVDHNIYIINKNIGILWDFTTVTDSNNLHLKMTYEFKPSTLLPKAMTVQKLTIPIQILQKKTQNI